MHTHTRRNYLCAETGIVELLFGALQGGGPRLSESTSARLSRLLRPITMTVKVSLHKLCLSLLLSPFRSFPHGAFKWRGQLALVWDPPLLCASPSSGPDWHLTLRPGQRGPKSMKWDWPQGCTVRQTTPYLAPPPPLAAGVPGVCRRPRGLGGELTAAGVKAQRAQEYIGQPCDVVTQRKTTLFLDYHLSSKPQLPFHLSLSTLEG